MGAALAWLQHVHGGGTCIAAADACVRRSHVGALLASTKAKALYNAHVHVATLACFHQGEAPSLRSVPRLSPAKAHACSTPYGCLLAAKAANMGYAAF